MNNKKIEKKVNRGFSSATPDIFNDVARSCANTTVMRPAPKATKKGGIFWKIATFALAFVLVAIGVFGGVDLYADTASASTVALDVNPSLQIVLNRNNRVVKVEPLNEDGEVIVGTKDYKNVPLDITVDAIIGSMLKHGYLSELANSVLVSVDSKQSAYDAIIKTVTEEIELTLKGANIEPSVLAQWVKDNDDVDKLVKDYKISKGKAQLICKIAAASTAYTVEELVELSVNDLSIILDGLVVEDVTQNGSASQKAYIGNQAALAKALEYVGDEQITAETISELEIELDFDCGIMMYEIEFAFGNYEYELEVGAVSGAVMSYKKTIAKHFENDPDAVALTEEEIVSAAIMSAGILDGVTVDAVAEQYMWERVWCVYFTVNDVFYEVILDNYGNLISLEEINLVASEEDSYVTRRDVKQIFLQNNTDGFNELSDLRRWEVKTAKDQQGNPVYNISFVFGESQYSYTMDFAGNLTNRKVVEHIKGELDDFFGNDWGGHGGEQGKWDDFQNDWNDHWDDYNHDDWMNDDVDETFEYEYVEGGYKYTVVMDFWGNIISQTKEPCESFKGVKVTVDQAKQIAADSLNANIEEVIFEECELDHYHGSITYQVELVYQGNEYVVIVDAKTGEVVK